MYENWQSIAIGLAFFIFLGWRFYRFRKVKGMLPQLLRNGAMLVDVRGPGEFALGHHPESINIPLSELSEKSKGWDRGRAIVLCCASGTRSGMALGLLKKNGFHSVFNVGPWTNTLTQERVRNGNQ